MCNTVGQTIIHFTNLLSQREAIKQGIALFFLSSPEGIFSLIFREEGRKWGRERNTYQLPPTCTRTRDGTCKPGMCPDWELHPQPLVHTGGSGLPQFLFQPLLSGHFEKSNSIDEKQLPNSASWNQTRSLCANLVSRIQASDCVSQHLFGRFTSFQVSIGTKINLHISKKNKRN